MKVEKGHAESGIVKEFNGVHIYRSVTPYDEYRDTVEYVVGKENGETVDRFDNLMIANKEFDNQLN